MLLVGFVGLGKAAGGDVLRVRLFGDVEMVSSGFESLCFGCTGG